MLDQAGVGLAASEWSEPGVAHPTKALGLPRQTLYDKLRRLQFFTDAFKQH